MAFDTKLNLTNARVEQLSGDTLTLSGVTNITTGTGDFQVDGVSVLPQLISGVTQGANGLKVLDPMVYGPGFLGLGGSLSEQVSINTSGNQFAITGGSLSLDGIRTLGDFSIKETNNQYELVTKPRTGFDNGTPTRLMESVFDSQSVTAAGPFGRFNDIDYIGGIRLKYDNLGGMVPDINMQQYQITNVAGTIIDLVESDYQDGYYIVGDTFPYFGKSDYYGTPDPTFTTYIFDGGLPTAVVRQSTGRVIIVGTFTSYSGITCNGIIRVFSDGSIDDSFDTGSGFTFGDDIFINRIVQNGDGTFYVGGNFTEFDGITVNGFVKLTIDGQIDNTFDVGTGFDVSDLKQIRDIRILQDGSIIVVGNFTSYNGTASIGVAKLNTDGSIDSGFLFFGGVVGVVRTVSNQTPDNAVFIGGDFTTVKGQPRQNIAKIFFDGTLDSDAVMKANGPVNGLVYISGGFVITIGEFFEFNDEVVHGFALPNYLSGILEGRRKRFFLKDTTYEYNGDFSSQYTLRSIPDVAFVRNQIGGSGFLKKAWRGLTADNLGSVGLGGDVSGYTTINIIQNEDAPVSNFGINSGFNPIMYSYGDIDGNGYTRYGHAGIYLEFDETGIASGISGATFVNFNSTARGIEYFNDHGPYFSNRSLVDKGWVLGQLTGGSGNTVANGLSKVGGVTVLGGLLTGSTIIGDETRTNISFLPEDGMLLIQNDSRIPAPLTVLDVEPSISLLIYYDSGSGNVFYDASGISDGLTVSIGVTSGDVFDYIFDQPDDVTTDNDFTVSTIVNGIGDFFHNGPLNSGQYALIYIYRQSPNAGSFYLLDGTAVNAATSGAPYDVMSNNVDGLIGPNMRKHFDDDLNVPFYPGVELRLSRLEFNEDGSLRVDSSNGTGIRAQFDYSDDTLANDSYVPRDWVEGKINNVAPKAFNGLRVIEDQNVAQLKAALGGTLVTGTTININTKEFKFVNTESSLEFKTNYQYTAGNPEADSNVRSLALQPDGKLVIGGNFSTVDNVNQRGVARINVDGSLDTTFLHPFTGSSSFITHVKVLSNGKIMVAGFLDITSGGVNYQGLIRLNSNGSVDTTFQSTTNAGIQSTINAIDEQSDGKIICVGTFIGYSGDTWNRIIRFNVDGSADGTFDPGTGFDGTCYAVTVLPDDKILVGGGFTAFDGDGAYRKLVRLDVDGAIDPTFLISTLLDSAVMQILYDVDADRIYVAAASGNSNVYIVDFTGALIANFHSNFAGVTNKDVFTIGRFSNGNLLFAGSFGTYTGQTAYRILEISPINGAVVNTFKVGTGFNNNVNKLVIDANDNVFVVGNFTSYKGFDAIRIVKIARDGAFNSNDIIVSGNTINYAGDYSETFQDNTLVTKKWVVEATSGATQRNISRQAVFFNESFTGTSITLYAYELQEVRLENATPISGGTGTTLVFITGDTILELMTAHLTFSGATNILQFPSNVVMQVEENRWDNTMKRLEISGGGRYQFSFAKVSGPKYQLIVSSRFHS